MKCSHIFIQCILVSYSSTIIPSSNAHKWPPSTFEHIGVTGSRTYIPLLIKTCKQPFPATEQQCCLCLRAGNKQDESAAGLVSLRGAFQDGVTRSCSVFWPAEFQSQITIGWVTAATLRAEFRKYC